MKRTNAAPVHTHSLRFVREPAERARIANCHANVVSTRQCDFFPVLRVDFAVVGDLPRILARMPIDADRPCRQ
ncbi:hypothetical protein AB3X91_38705 [Paraburkholderia sp. BR14263]|uniref:hypothetical protein n=1 Tax=unclassified Paraburkholderia TaxID=2615204 RepID=UPI0034CDC348